MSIQETIQSLAADFAASVLAAIREATLEEIVELKVAGTSTPSSKRATAPTASHKSVPARASSGRLARRSDEDVAKVVDRICALLAKAKDGLRAEVLREKLGVEAKELPRPIAQALKEKRITKSGNKRATTYKLGNTKPATKDNAKPATKKAAAKPAKKAAPKKKVAPKKEATKATNGVATP